MFGTDYDKNHGMDNKDFPEWVGKKMESTFHGFCHPLHYNDNIICSKKEELKEKYKNKHILILGGGGSTLKFLDSLEFSKVWALKNPDFYKWTMNNFFKSAKISSYKIDLVSFGPEVDLQDNYLGEYLNFFQVDVGIELHQKWSREPLNSSLVKEVNDFQNISKFCFQTKYFSILGSGARLIILACELGVKSISFTGFDGPLAIFEGNHSFEPGKTFLTYRAQGYSKEDTHKLFFNEYQWFWTYIKTNYPNTKIIPLEDPYKLHAILYN